MILAVDLADPSDPPDSRPRLQIRAEEISFTNITLQIEPHETNSDYYTNYGTNLIVSGECEMTAFVGPCVRLTWSGATSAVILSQSTNLESWQDLRIVFHPGATQWLANPFESRFYRLRLP